jgi:diaminopimelate epimerase
MRLEFAKYEGLGNDFVVIVAVGSQTTLDLSARQAQALCDRHRGIGADGVLLVELGEASAKMRVINADGSRPEMCGNGLRCVALHLVRTGHAEASASFVVDTDSGPHTCKVERDARESAVQVSMRAASLVPAEIPVLAEQALIDEDIDAGATRVRVSCVSMGNPHAVTFDDIGVNARATLGPLLEKHARFPHGANVGFARVLATQQIELAVWERGVGFTEACGTGACACAVAAVETGRAERHQPIEIRLPGGPLTIVVGERNERISMTGPARHVFDGVLTL